MAKSLGELIDSDDVTTGGGYGYEQGSIMTGLLVLSVLVLIIGLYMLISTRDSRSTTRDVATGLAFFGAVGTIFLAAKCVMK